MNALQICPPHLSDIANLPCEVQKSRFWHYYSYTSDYLRLMFDRVIQKVDVLGDTVYT